MARGHIQIKVDKLISDRDMSINKVCHRAEMQRGQLNKYRKNTISLLDVDVLARLCEAFECEISDILEYIPPESNDSKN